MGIVIEANMLNTSGCNNQLFHLARCNLISHACIIIVLTDDNCNSPCTYLTPVSINISPVHISHVQYYYYYYYLHAFQRLQISLYWSTDSPTDSPPTSPMLVITSKYYNIEEVLVSWFICKLAPPVS